MVNCKACGKEIAKGVKQCVYCGKDQRNFFMRHKILTAIIAIIILVVIGQAIGGDEEPVVKEEASETVDSEKSDKTEKAKEDNAEDQRFKIGDAVELDNQVVKVTKVEKSSGNDFDKPAEGKEYVIVHVSIENDGEEEIPYNPFHFKMKNSDGQIEKQGLTTIDTDTALSSGKLAPGGNVSGTIPFEQPIDDDGLELIFELDSEQIIFELN